MFYYKASTGVQCISKVKSDYACSVTCAVFTLGLLCLGIWLERHRPSMQISLSSRQLALNGSWFRAIIIHCWL